MASGPIGLVICQSTSGTIFQRQVQLTQSAFVMRKPRMGNSKITEFVKYDIRLIIQINICKSSLQMPQSKWSHSIRKKLIQINKSLPMHLLVKGIAY